MQSKTYSGKVKNSLWWWLGKQKPFILDDQFKIELLFIDKINHSAKIRITNLKTGIAIESSANPSEVSDGQD